MDLHFNRLGSEGCVTVAEALAALQRGSDDIAGGGEAADGGVAGHGVGRAAGSGGGEEGPSPASGAGQDCSESGGGGGRAGGGLAVVDLRCNQLRSGGQRRVQELLRHVPRLQL